MRIRTFVRLTLVFVFLTEAAHSQAIRNAIPDVARPLPLSSVRVTGGPLKRAQDLNADYLLKLEPDRMMAYYRKRAGLEPKGQGATRVGTATAEILPATSPDIISPVCR